MGDNNEGYDIDLDGKGIRIILVIRAWRIKNGE